MQLDQTRIAIRERGILEILDLALPVIRTHAAPLAIAWFIGLLPWAVLNWWLIGWMAAPEWEEGGIVRFTWNMLLLVFLEAPVAMSFVTLYLGDAMFLQPTTARRIAGDFFKLLPRLTPSMLLLRGVLPAIFLLSMARLEEEVTSWEIFLWLTVVYVFILRGMRPFIGEIILLERNPLRAASKKLMTVGRRSGALHNPNAGDLIVHWMAAVALSIAMTVAFVFCFWFVWGVLLNDWNWGPIMIQVCVPASMWLVAGYFAVVRFLTYLDLRIRREGWEVELRLRAEASRIAKQLVA